LLSSHNIRGSSLQRWVQISCGVLVLSIVIICLFTLVKLPSSSYDKSAEIRTRNEEFSDSLLVKRIQSTLPNCPPDHSRQALSCKMQAEFDMFLRSNKRWFCHFDDDQYVNVLALEDKLRGLDSNQDWYLGKPSIEKPLEIMDRDSPGPDMKVVTS